MDYQALYRKYRPQRFDEVVGQRHVTQTLAREVVEGKVAHAYLFAGPRGTGKTTTARLLAKSLNCANRGPEGEPDNTCPSCVAITAGGSLDVIELDAASHNKVEDVREIRINVGSVAASAGSRRVYILDEAHMLSRAAGNALLKTLEEPPEHVVFVLATTEPYKLLDTIRSRSQRFDFHPVGSEILADHLADIAGREDIDVDKAALAMVAAHARGSVRDGMSLLEQVAALGDGTVRTPVVTRALGLADRDAFSRLASALVDGDAPGALGLVAEMASRGTDLRRFVSEAVEYFRGIFLAQWAPNLEEVVDEPSETLDEWRRHAGAIPRSEVLRAIDLLGDALLQLRQGREERLVIEVALLKLTRPETATDIPSLVTRIDRLESRLRDMARRPADAAGDTTTPPDVPVAPTRTPAPPPAAAPAAPSTVPSSATASSKPTATASTSDRPDSPVAGASPGATAPGPTAPGPTATGPGHSTSAAAVPAGGDFDLGSFQTIWPALVARVRDATGPVRHALVKVAAPVSVEAGVARLEVPAHMSFHLERLRADTELQTQMSAIAGELLGAPVTIEWVGGDGSTPAAAEAPQPERAPDKDDMADAGDGDDDPTDLVVDIFGGEIVSE